MRLVSVAGYWISVDKGFGSAPPVSEVYRQQSDLGAASDYIDRALFAFERAFVPAFNVSLGTARLDFGRVENRGFFLALTRDLQCVGQLV